MKIGVIALISGGLLWFTLAGDAAQRTPILLEQIRILSVVQQFSIQAGWVSSSVPHWPAAPPLLPGHRKEPGSQLNPETLSLCLCLRLSLCLKNTIAQQSGTA